MSKATDALKSGVEVEVQVRPGVWRRGILDGIEFSHMHGGRTVNNCRVLVEGMPVVARRHDVRNMRTQAKGATAGPENEG